MNRAQSLTACLPRVRLAYLPTPLEPATRLSAAVGGPDIWIKREDLSALALGGNKARQLEFLMGDALAHGAQAVVTTAAVQSNFCRACAAAGAALGIHVALLLRGNGSELVQGNFLLDRLFGAEVRFIDTRDPYDPIIAPALDAFVAALQARGLTTQVLHMPGRTGSLGAAAMVDTGQEMARQFAEHGIEPRAVYMATGSGLTVAGVALAFKALGLKTRVVGVSVQRGADFIRPLIVERANAAAQLLGLAVQLQGSDFDIDDRHLGDGYGQPSPAGLEAMLLVARSQGIVLDPVYTGKGMAGMLAQLRTGSGADDRPVVFFHSGGAPGLFALAPQVAHAL